MSYGSNLYSPRFRCYLQGGTPTGGGRSLPGARNQAFPELSRLVQLPGSVYFAKSSRSWHGGGVAFYDHNQPGETRARAWLVTDQQFADIAAQESGRPLGVDGDPSLKAIRNAGPAGLCTGSGWYDRALYLGDLDERPMFTVTAPWSFEDEPPSRPSAEYLTMIAAGLVESGWFDVDGAGRHLAELRGCAGTWGPTGIAELVTRLRVQRPAGGGG